MSLARRSVAPALVAFALAALAPAEDLTVVYKETGGKAGDLRPSTSRKSGCG